MAFKDLTRQDRMGAVAARFRWLRRMPPYADGAISQADRQQVAGSYPGLLADEATPSGGLDLWLLNHHHHINGEN